MKEPYEENKRIDEKIILRRIGDTDTSEESANPDGKDEDDYHDEE
jgi:hypothetical protein